MKKKTPYWRMFGFLFFHHLLNPECSVTDASRVMVLNVKGRRRRRKEGACADCGEPGGRDKCVKCEGPA